MVTTRSAGASEPLEELQTPPKRTRKAKKKPISIPLNPIPSSISDAIPHESVQDLRDVLAPETEAEVCAETTCSPMDLDGPSLLQSIECETPAISTENLTTAAEESPSKPLGPSSGNSSNKRPRDANEEEAEQSNNSKRLRKQPIPAHIDAEELLFPSKMTSVEQIDYDLANSTPIKSYAEQIRRDRRKREIARRNNRLGITPRRTKLPTYDGDNPFGIETFSPYEKAAMAKAQHDRETARAPSYERSQRQDRSAAPEPETPRRGLFGSLKDLGSAALGRLGSPFGSLTSRVDTPQHATAPHPRSEPRRRPVWDIEYPELGQSQASHGPESRQDAHAHDPNAENPSQARRRLPNPDGDDDEDYNPHLPPQPMSAAARAAAAARKARRDRLHGRTPNDTTPKATPLFGPNSHFAKGTKNPDYEEFHKPGPHPAYRKFAGNKRSFDEALPSIPLSHAESTSRTFQPYVEDDNEANDDPEQGPSTPSAKRQKTAGPSGAQTPRSALKAPGTIGKSGRSARFNDNPIASVKRMSPIYGSARAGDYPYSPDNLFSTFEDDRLHQNDDSTLLSDPSPTTMNNTRLNTGLKRHPGELLTSKLKPALAHIQFEWSDPNDPSWRPSLANPRPGHFRVPDFENELDDDDDDDDLMLSPPPGETATPPPPSTPRPAHAELPKNNAATPQAPLSASALEAANLERRRAEATKTKPRTSSRLAEVTSARSRSPSPPALEADEAGDGSDTSAKTPSPIIDSTASLPTWTWDAETNQYISSSTAHPDFAYNAQDELVPSFCLKTASGKYDNSVPGPDKMTEAQRQAHYAKKYDDAWASKEFSFDDPQTYEEAGVGSTYIHELIRKNDERYPQVVKQCDERFAEEWDAHQTAIDAAMAQGKILVATFPDRDGIDMLDAEEL